MHLDGQSVEHAKKESLALLASLHGTLTLRNYRRDLSQDQCRSIRVMGVETAPPYGCRLEFNTRCGTLIMQVKKKS